MQPIQSPSKPIKKGGTLDVYFKPNSESKDQNPHQLDASTGIAKLHAKEEDSKDVETPLKTEAQNTKDHSEEK